MIHYHGGRHSTWRLAVEVWRRRHALVSFADPQQIAIASEVAQSFALDNGAFTSWKQSLEIDWRSYYDWVEEWLHHPGFDWAVIPNVTGSQAEDNDTLIAERSFGPHRILCGDCRDATVVTKLFEGRKANVVVTSPPYATQREYDPVSGFRPVAPEDYVDWYRAVAATIASVLAGDGSYFLNIKKHAEDGQRHLYVKDLFIAHVRQ